MRVCVFLPSLEVVVPADVARSHFAQVLHVRLLARHSVLRLPNARRETMERLNLYDNTVPGLQGARWTGVRKRSPLEDDHPCCKFDRRTVDG